VAGREGGGVVDGHSVDLVFVVDAALCSSDVKFGCGKTDLRGLVRMFVKPTRL
jgi:hypothetical protein